METIKRICGGEYEYKGMRLRSCGYSYDQRSNKWEVETEGGLKIHCDSRKEALKLIDDWSNER